MSHSFIHSLIFLNQICTSESLWEFFQSTQTQTIGRQIEIWVSGGWGEGLRGVECRRGLGTGFICFQNIPRLCCFLLLDRKPCTHSFLHHSLNKHSLNVKDYISWWEDNGPYAEVLRLGCTSETPGELLKILMPRLCSRATKSELFRSRTQASAFLKCSIWFQHFGLEVKEFFESMGYGRWGLSPSFPREVNKTSL